MRATPAPIYGLDIVARCKRGVWEVASRLHHFIQKNKIIFMVLHQIRSYFSSLLIPVRFYDSIITFRLLSFLLQLFLISTDEIERDLTCSVSKDIAEEAKESMGR